MYDQDFKQDVCVVSFRYPRQGGFQEVLVRGWVTHRKVGPHGTEGVRCTLARFSSVMYGIVLGVTPPDTFRKMNSDNIVCSTLTPNIMNEYDYEYDCVMIMVILCYRTCTSLCK